MEQITLGIAKMLAGQAAPRKRVDVKLRAVKEERRAPRVDKKRLKDQKRKISDKTREGRPVTYLPKHTEYGYAEFRYLKGVVVPMGHGKTMLGKEEGWIDCDCLVPPRRQKRLRDTFLEHISETGSIEEASLCMVDEMRETLRTMVLSSDAILMAPTFSILEALGVEIVGCVVVNPSHVIERNRHRDEHEQLMIIKNCEEAVECASLRECGLLTADDMDDVRWYIYNICEMIGIGVGCPMEYDVLTNSVKDYRFGYRKSNSIKDVVDAFYRMEVTREVVNYQVFANGISSYQGFGVTANDWAKACSKVAGARNREYYTDTDWSGWPISLKDLHKVSDLSEHEDVMMIVNAHKGEHERFIVALVMHWKLHGAVSAIAKELFPLYLIRRCNWRDCFDSLRELIISSNSLYGVSLLKEERELVLGMRLLCVGDTGELSRMLEGQNGSSPRMAPSTETERKISAAFNKVVYKKEDQVDLLDQLDCPEIQAVRAKASKKRCELIGLALGNELLHRWAGEKHLVARVTSAVKSVMIGWYRVSLIRDEWSDLLCRLLDEEAEPGDIEDAIIASISCNSADGASGSGWASRVFETTKSFMLCGLVKKEGCIIAMQSRGGAISPCVVGMSEGDLWQAIVKNNVPKSVLGTFQAGVNSLQDLVEIALWSANPAVRVLEMVNLTSWFPDISKRAMTAMVCRWNEVRAEKQDRRLLDKCLSSYTQKVFKKTFSEVADGLVKLIDIAPKYGGLGCSEKMCRADIPMVDGMWTGHGRVHRGASRVQATTTKNELLEKYQDDTSKVKDRITAGSFYRCGAVGVCMLEKKRKGDINSHAKLLKELGM